MFCPYCGEELDDDAATCERCGAALSLEAAAEGAEGGDDGAATETGRPTKKDVTLVDCPHCEAPQPEHYHRCTECGRAMKDLVDEEVLREQRALKMKIYGAVAGGVLLLLLLFIFLGTRRGPLPEDRPRAGYEPAKLHQVLTTDKIDDKRRKREWKRVFKKYVTWTGELTDRSGHTLYLDVGEDDEVIAEVVVDDRRTAKIKASTGDEVTVLARVMDHGEPGANPFFYLEDGEVK